VFTKDLIPNIIFQQSRS